MADTLLGFLGGRVKTMQVHCEFSFPALKFRLRERERGKQKGQKGIHK